MAARHPDLARQLAALPEPGLPAYDIVPTSSGVPSLKYTDANGAGYLLMDEERPLQAMETWLAQPNKTGLSGGQVVFLGLGLGYHLLIALSRFAPETRFLCIERDLSLLALVCRHVDLCPLWDNARFQMEVVPEPAGEGRRLSHRLHGPTVLARGLRALVFPPLQNLFPEWVEAARGELDAAALMLKTNRATRAGEARAQGMHALANLPWIARSPGVSRLFGQFTDVPAVVVSAGPSLSRDMQLLSRYRDRVLVIAVDTAYRVLAREGIHADLVVALDFTDLNVRHFEGMNPSPDAFLVMEPQVHPEIPERFDRPAFIFRGSAEERRERFSNPVLRWLFLRTEEKGHLVSVATTSITALDLARQAGCPGIALLGQDLAYTGGARYAKGAMQEETGLAAARDPGSRTVRGVSGEDLPTSDLLYLFKFELERYLRTHELSVVNASGGAAIEGTTVDSLESFLEEHAADEPAELTERLHDLHAPAPATGGAALRAELARAAGALDAVAREARDGIARIEASDDFDRVGREVTARLFENEEALGLAIPCIGPALDRFHDADVGLAAETDAKRRARMTRKRHLSLLSEIAQGAGAMAGHVRDGMERLEDAP